MTNQDHPMEEDEFRRAVRREFDVQRMPPAVEQKLRQTYAALGSIPQDRPTAASTGTGNGKASAVHGRRRGARVVRRGFVIAAAAVLVVLVAGSAFAASRLIQMQSGDPGFFGPGENLPVYDSLQAGVSSLNAPVGETVTLENGTRITLDTVSCDRSIVNLFFTLEKDGGFDLDEQSIYEGSQENEWTRLQWIAPHLSYRIESNGEHLAEGGVNQLDAYREGDAVKVMQRIVPEKVLPDQVDVVLEGSYVERGSVNEPPERYTLDVGLDLATVSQPRELGAQDVVFPTSEGEKTIGIERFTASELGTVMVVRNDNVWTGEPRTEGSSFGPPENVLSPGSLKITDDQGNVLHFVQAGDGGGYDPSAPTVVELAGLAADAKSVTFAPMMSTEAAKRGVGNDDEAIAARKALNEANDGHVVDVSQIGAKLDTSEYGGYEVSRWDVSDNTVTIGLKPYGWVANGFRAMFELIPVEDATLLASEYTNVDTGETGVGYHSAIRYEKYDYLTGEIVQMDSYYAASDEELRSLTQYHYSTSFGFYNEEAAAAQTLAFTS